MFGVVVASLDNVSEEEKARYQQAYCGLCHSLKSRYGQTSRFCVNFDMAFLSLLLGSLYDEEEQRLEGRCAVHPSKPHYFMSSRFVDYAADMSLILAYHKCIDNWVDEKSASSLAYSKVISRGYREVEQNYESLCRTTSAVLSRIRCLEDESMGADASKAEMRLTSERPSDHEGTLQRADEIAGLFGRIMGDMFAFHGGYWERSLARFGYELGRFVYFMDAAIDREDDMRSGSYNPFNICRFPEEDVLLILNDAIGNAARIFESLPLEKDLHLLRSVLYAGVWQKLYAKQHAGKEDLSGQGQHAE